MKRVLSLFILITLFFSTTLAFGAKAKKKKPKKTKQKIEVLTKDKFILAGDIYLSSTPSNKPLVVLVHSFSMNALSWATLAQNLREKGYNVVAMDLRGHGRSVYNEKLKYKSRYNFKDSDWQKLPSDIQDTIKYVKDNFSKIDTTHTILVGADVGANACALAGSMMKIPPQKLVLISPMYEFKGLKMPTKTLRFQESKLMLVLSKSDKLFFSLNTKTPPVVKKYPLGGPGMQLIKANKSAVFDIVNFIIN